MSNTRPFIEKPPSILNKPDGSVLFECMIQSKEPPEIKWFHKDKASSLNYATPLVKLVDSMIPQELASDDRHAMKMKKMVGKFACTLTIKSPQQSDQGIYKVVATNAHGSHDQQQNYVLMCTANSMYPE